MQHSSVPTPFCHNALYASRDFACFKRVQRRSKIIIIWARVYRDYCESAVKSARNGSRISRPKMQWRSEGGNQAVEGGIMQFAWCEVKYSSPHNPIRKVSTVETNLWCSFTLGNVGVQLNDFYFYLTGSLSISYENKDPNVCNIYYLRVLKDIPSITM